MRTLAFDGRMGASGDMLLGALIAAGADPDALEVAEAELPVRYDVGPVRKKGIAATSVNVLSTGEGDGGDGHGHDDGGEEYGHDDGGEEHGHENDGHSHADGDDHHGATPAEGRGPHRSYGEVLDIVESMALPTGVRADAEAVFELLGEAEASVHGTDLTETHFHEVGADDAVADVVGAALLIDDLGAERVVTTPLAAGDGTVEMGHGTYPVPAPAVVELAESADWSLRGGPVEAELLTPTGAAILAHFAEGVESLPALDVTASGYGAGGYDFADRPNVLRAVVGDGGSLERDEITVLETHLDDATPEVLGHLQETLTDAGARDVTLVPTTMKKSRPGHLVKVVAKPEDAERVARRLAVETGTLGVREHGAGHRWIADRRIETVAIDVDGESYEVDVKVASAGDDTIDVSAEFDDAAAVAAETDLPVREVIRRAEAAHRR